MANMKHPIVDALGWLFNSRKDILCMTASMLRNVRGEKEYNLKRGFTPEQYGRFLEDVNFEMDANLLVGIIIWYTDGSYSWASDADDKINWSHHDRPDPDNFNL